MYFVFFFIKRKDICERKQVVAVVLFVVNYCTTLATVVERVERRGTRVIGIWRHLSSEGKKKKQRT